MECEIKEFIMRRFSQDCNWMDGNCYFFAVILREVFGGEIYYDVIDGHFIIKIDGDYYDWTGKVAESKSFVRWENFEDYDYLQKERIKNDCIK